MRMLLKMAWRNLFRNKRRTFIAGTAIGIGLASLIFVDALMIGMKENMIDSATESFTGEAQIHRQNYQESRDVEMTVKNADSVMSALSRDPVVAAFAPRTYAFAMITSPSNVNSIQLVGIDADREPALSLIDETMQKGEYLGEQSERQLIIGSELADILKLSLNDRAVITVAQASGGDMTQEMFRVTGIYHFNIPEMDKGMAFVPLKKAQEMLNLNNQIHEIAINFTNSEIAQQSKHPFWQRYNRMGNRASSWTELMPQLEAALGLTDFSTLIIAFILFGVVALGIINTLFMSIHERIFEFGVLRAVGTRPGAVGLLIFFEAGCLAFISILWGCLLGYVLTWIVSQTGIDYTGIEFAGVTFRRLLYPVLQIHQFMTYPFWVFVFTLVIGLYPARYAAKMSPAEALQKTI
jgi:ABC-type lipoprotein release transport system permease subunit